jgi:hypothetical protein
MFGVADNAGSTTSHLMLYAPVYAEDGKVWLNNNLGAHYATISHASFNPNKQATSATDHLAYGSLFQWGRKPDGHELMTYSNSTTGIAINGTTTILNNNPSHAFFIINSSGTYDWRTTQDNALWSSVSSVNNPCPQGYRVATITEFGSLISSALVTNNSKAANSVLKFSNSGNRLFTGLFNGLGDYSYYWSSSSSSGQSNHQYFDISSQSVVLEYRAFGSSLRCIYNY